MINEPGRIPTFYSHRSGHRILLIPHQPLTVRYAVDYVLTWYLTQLAGNHDNSIPNESKILPSIPSKRLFALADVVPATGANQDVKLESTVFFLRKIKCDSMTFTLLPLYEEFPLPPPTSNIL